MHHPSKREKREMEFLGGRRGRGRVFGVKVVEIATEVVVDDVAVELESSSEHLVVRSPLVRGDDEVLDLFESLETVGTADFVAVVDDGLDQIGVSVELVQV